MEGFEFKENYNFNDLVNIVRLLRAPNGCPWDREQTHTSIRKNFLEETYEVCEAIDLNDTELLREELGDVLLQVVMHAQMESENRTFDISDVCNDICKKLIIRHPHIFSTEKAESAEKVLDNWDKIKMQTKNQSTVSQSMESICRALPSLMRSEKVQKKAKKVGFDWENCAGAIDKLDEELLELKGAVNENNFVHIEEELGDLLFSVVNAARWLDIDAELALNKSCDKFIKRFKAMEALAESRDIQLKELTMSELDSLWEEVKINA